MDISDKAFEDYDPKKDTRKYKVYRNDIKYLEHRNIDPVRAEWDEHVKKDFDAKITDTIKYRMRECKLEDFESLELSHVSGDIFLDLFKNTMFLNNISIIKNLFIKDSKIKKLPDLTTMTGLVTLDVSHNELTELKNLPMSLEELVTDTNKLTCFNLKLPFLKRLNCSNNNISSITYSESLESLYINNNPIKELSKLEKLYFLNCSGTEILTIPSLPKLVDLECPKSKVTSIGAMPVLKYLDCLETNVEVIISMPFLEELICSKSKIKIIEEMNSLITLDCSSTNIEYLPEFKKLQELNCSKTKLESLNIYNNLLKLDCSYTKIKKIPDLKNLEELSCNVSLVETIEPLDKLKSLKCANTKICNLPLLPKLEYLDCVGTKMTTINAYPKLITLAANSLLLNIPYMEKLRTLVINEKLINNLLLSEKYKIKSLKKNSNNTYVVTFCSNNS